jgi:chorismate mutase
MACRGIRGAITVDVDEADAILAATRELLERIVSANGLCVEDLASVVFTATPDLTAAYPAQAARDIGWHHTPLLCMQEMAVNDSVSHCIRVLAMWNTDRPPDQVHHVYLGRARALRPDLAEEGAE